MGAKLSVVVLTITGPAPTAGHEGENDDREHLHRDHGPDGPVRLDGRHPRRRAGRIVRRDLTPFVGHASIPTAVGWKRDDPEHGKEELLR